MLEGIQLHLLLFKFHVFIIKQKKNKVKDV